MRARTLPRLAALTSACGLGLLAAQAEDAPVPARVEVPVMRTSIYVGSVTLTTTAFERAGDAWSATYDARVFPWAFWSEHGSITISVPEAEIARLMSGETVEFTGDARNHKGKPRTVAGRAQPAGKHDGRIKVRIRVDGVELIFNGDYRLAPPP